MKKKIDNNSSKTAHVQNGTNLDKGVKENDTADIGSNSEDAVEQKYPEGVVAPPRNEEELHLDIFKNNPEGILTYLPVSDDVGEVLGDTELEQQVKAFCQRYKDSDTEKLPDIETVIEEAKGLASKYTLQTNMADNRLGGTITKYRIRQGVLFNILKKLVQSKGLMWTYWFKENFDKRDFRTVEDYMRLAKIPGMIRYAFLGKERLILLSPYLKEFGTETADPVGDFFMKYIVFHPGEEIDVQEVKIKTDIAINHQRCIKAGLDEITMDMIDSLVRNGQKIEPKVLNELKVRKKDGMDVVANFYEIVAADGKFKPLPTPERRADWFKNTANRFISAVQDAMKEPEYQSQFDVALITKLKGIVVELEQQVQSNMQQPAGDSTTDATNSTGN